MSAPEDHQDSDHKPAGRVRHDSTGRAIWEWAADSGRHAIDSTSRLLKRLDLPGLSLADDEKKKHDDEEESRAAERQVGATPVVPTFGGPRERDPIVNSKRSFNPYDARVPVKRVATPARKPVAAKPPAKKRGLFARLFGKK